jgi:hypothetical protein
MLGWNGKKFVVHLNWLKACHGSAHYSPYRACKQSGNSGQKRDMSPGPDKEADMYSEGILSYPLPSDN